MDTLRMEKGWKSEGQLGRVSRKSRKDWRSSHIPG